MSFKWAITLAVTISLTLIWLLTLLFVFIVEDIESHMNESRSYINSKVVYGNDTLTVVDYSLINGFRLTNNEYVSDEYLKEHTLLGKLTTP